MKVISEIPAEVNNYSGPDYLIKVTSKELANILGEYSMSDVPNGKIEASMRGLTIPVSNIYQNYYSVKHVQKNHADVIDKLAVVIETLKPVEFDLKELLDEYNKDKKES